MKISVIYIYWFLLLISVISSCLLFILVAAEGIKSSSLEKPSLEDDSEQINTFEGGKSGQLTPDPVPEASINDRAELKSSFEEISQEIEQSEPNKDFLLAQNSGLSDTGQAVVFTLVDTASAELQQRADNLPGTQITAHQAPQQLNAAPGAIDNGSLPPVPGLNYTSTVLVPRVGGTDTATGATITSGVPVGSEREEGTIEKGEDGVNSTDTESSSQTQQTDNYVVRAEPKILNQEKEDSSNITSQQKPESSTNPPLTDPTEQPSTPEPTDQEKEVPEDIPSFSEWTQKQLQEAEKKKEKVNTSTQNNQMNKNTSNLKLRSKNYASPDCGAKIVAANPEAISAGSVLSPSRDEYKLNTCTSRIWFIVELCEAIQAKKIDLANFELFSSSPKDFSVSVSDRFPSRDWSSVGQFQAKDERDIQSFNLHPHLFGKFIKVEMMSHWGSEHFCPISLFRVYGTSEFEVLETEDLQETISEDDDEDETLDSYKGEPSNNLFGSARDAVMSIVKKAAEVLVKSNDNSNQTIRNQSVKYSPLINTCSTPSHIVVCDNCSDILFGEVYELLSCKSDYLHSLVNIAIVNKSLYNTDICVEYGLNFFSKTVYRQTDSHCNYISNFFAPKYVAAMCNVLAVLENKVVLNISSQYSNNTTVDNETLSTSSFNINSKIAEVIEISSCVTDGISEVKTCASVKTDASIETKPIVIIEKSFVEESSELQINPTKTLSNKDTNLDSTQQIQEDTPIVPTGQDLGLDPSETAQISLETSTGGNKNVTEENESEINSQQATVTLDAADTSTETFEYGHDQLDTLLSELTLEPEEGKGNQATTVAPPSNVPQQAQKESVFLRLSNRIKALERNMSLSGQYLEELSRRYKKQVEEMQRVFEKKLSLLSDENKRRDEEQQQLQQKIDRLTSSIESLLTERDSLWKTASLLGQFLLIEVIITFILIYFCWRTPESNSQDPKNKKKIVNGQIKRRKSIDTIGHESPVVKRRRRPSEEALQITGTYKDLLITDEVDSTNGLISKAEKRRRRKKNALLRSQSVVAYQNKLQNSSDEPTRRASSSEMNRALLAQELMNGDLTPPAKIQEIPFVLEESEHSSVEPVDYFAETTKVPNITTVTGKTTKNGSLKSSLLKSHSPLFMKTALSTRSKRSSTTKRLNLFKTDKHTRSSPDSSVKSMENNSFSVSDSQDDQTSLNSDSSKKEKRLGGLKRMFKKVF